MYDISMKICTIFISIVIFILLHMYMYFAFIKSFVFTLIEKSAKLIQYIIGASISFIVQYHGNVMWAVEDAFFLLFIYVEALLVALVTFLLGVLVLCCYLFC